MTGEQHVADRPLSVAEVQQALRDLRARPATGLPTGGGDTTPQPARTRGDIGRGELGDWADNDTSAARRISVLAAHAGAGSSAVSLALSDAVAATGRTVHLIDEADPGTSGLIMAASSELGLDDTGVWRRGRRGSVTIDRRASSSVERTGPTALPSPAAVVVFDHGGCAHVPTPAPSVDAVIVIVCRTTVPGVRLLERCLEQLAGRRVVVAALGRSRWPAEVTASLGPRLAALRSARRVVAVPVDGRLAVRGLDDRPLPKGVHAAGLALLDLMGDLPRLPSRAPGEAPTSHRAAR